MSSPTPCAQSRWFRVVDDFYAHPDEVRATALRMEYREPAGVSGWRSVPYLPNGIKHRIKRAFGLSIEDWPTDTRSISTGNGTFFLSRASGPRSDAVAVHYDEPISYATLVVYLTPEPPRDTGLSFWQHRATGLTGAPTRTDAGRLGSTVTELRAHLEADAWSPRRWLEVDRVQNAYNRAVVFRAGMLHSATRHFGARVSTARLYHSFHFVGASPHARSATER